MAYADNTSIQIPDDDPVNVVMNAFRRLVSPERDIGCTTTAIEQSGAGQDDLEAAAFAKILAQFLSPRFIAR